MRAVLIPQGRNPGPAATPASFRDVCRTLTSARDEQIMRVVSLVDAMPHRGAADTLLAPLRPRLTLLRPRRPLNFTRLLFWPFDPVILEATKWRRGSLGLPRSCLVPLARHIRAARPQLASSLDTAIIGVSTDDLAPMLDCGVELWEQAAKALAEAGMPANWAEATGLSQADYDTLSGSVSIVLGRAAQAMSLVLDVLAGELPALQQVRSILTEINQAALPHGQAVSTQAVGMMLAILLARLPNTEPLITLAIDLAVTTSEPTIRLAADQAIDFILDDIETTPAVTGDLRMAADEIVRIATLLDALVGPGLAQMPSRKPRVERLRQQIDTACRSRFEADLTAQILAPAGSLGSDATDMDVQAIETAARGLLRFEAAGRQLGGAGFYDTRLRKATDALLRHTGDAISPVDRARVVEILAGSEQALAVLSMK